MRARRRIALRSLGMLGPLLVALVPARSDAIPFAGTLSISISGLDSVEMFGAGSSLGGAGIAIPGGVFSAMTTHLLSGLPPVTRVRWSVTNGPLVVAGSPLSGPGPVRGQVSVFGNLGGGPLTLALVPLALTTHGAASAPIVAAGLGVGGMTTIYLGMGTTTASPVPVTFQPWGTGPVQVSGWFAGVPYTYHFATGMMASVVLTLTTPVEARTYVGSDSRTPGGRGQLTLVSPTKVSVPILGQTIVVLGVLTLHSPEPGTLGLMGLGVAGLAALGRWRLARRRRAGAAA